jgi:site-specific DNA recombinase
MAERLPIRRCVVYTRKSSEEGLDQAYNSLDAQRDACCAYIASQKHEGWVHVDKRYDDGGFSGGNLQRPALKLLLEDMAKGLIDIIVVYKIDRLTRSLADFAKLTDVLDKHDVSFVAVTQQFNTSTSMGRLTLNVLLSFAQFEREVAGERIRDKIAASKRRGMWLGGRIPIGYDIRDKKLVINQQEAETVRHIFKRYLDLKSVKLLQTDLEQSRITSKAHLAKDGTPCGACVIYRGALSHILTNQIYRGMIAFKGELYDGEHERVVSDDLFQAVQISLAHQGPGEAAKAKRASPALLKGLVYDSQGSRLQPTHSCKLGRKYRYYVSASKIRDKSADPKGLRIPASDLEKLVVTAIAKKLGDDSWVTATFAGIDQACELKPMIERALELAKRVERQSVQRDDILQTIINRIDVSNTSVAIKLHMNALSKMIIANAGADLFTSTKIALAEIIVSGTFLRCGKQVRLVLGHDDPKQNNPNYRLVQEIVRARRWFKDLSSGKANSIAELARRESCSAPYISRKISLAFLAPDIVQCIVDGTQPQTLTPERLKKACPLPISWEEQRAMLLAN